MSATTIAPRSQAHPVARGRLRHDIAVLMVAVGTLIVLFALVISAPMWPNAI